MNKNQNKYTKMKCGIAHCRCTSRRWLVVTIRSGQRRWLGICLFHYQRNYFETFVKLKNTKYIINETGLRRQLKIAHNGTYKIYPVVNAPLKEPNYAEITCHKPFFKKGISKSKGVKSAKRTA